MKKTTSIIVTLFLFSLFQINAQALVISESFGWLESLTVKWEPISEAQSYNVYYSGNGFVDKKIDDQLIRSYGTYFRADIPGLKAGDYTVKIVPVISGVESESAETPSLTVLPHDRTGFAFHGGRMPGAYKADGTPKDGAEVIYITENNKNIISMNVAGANSNPCVGLQEILDGFKKGNDARPLIVRLVGQITDLDYMLNGDIVIENKNNTASYITFEGVGDDAVADGWGLRIKNATNIEVRNIGFMNCDSGEGDNIGLQQNNSYIWVHNCDLFYGHAGSAGDQAKGDGALDVKGSKFVTISYNHFWDTGKSNLLGLGENTTIDYFITYHHNWYDHSDSRHPRVRYYSAHVYNNYYDGISKYGVGSTMGSSVFVEGNFFRNCKYPMLISMQGSDIINGTGIFSSEDGGIIKAYNNSMSGQARFVPYDVTNYPVEFDAYVASSRSELVGNSVKSKKGGNTYNNFDTDPTFYVKDLVIDDPETAKEKVILHAGRVQGGDFKWTFNNAVDDTSYDVNPALKSALTNYKTSLVAVQGDASSSPSSQTLTSTGNNSQTVAEGSPIEPIIFTWGGDATDVTIVGLPASGIIFEKNADEKTVTITGTPTAGVSYSITTSGTTGTPVTASGTIAIAGSGSTFIHNFTADGKTSSFYTISGNLSTNYGTVTYDGITLTQCLKMESSTNISFTTTEVSTLTLVFNKNYTGDIKIDGVTYRPASTQNGIIVINDFPAGVHTILKGSGSSFLFYMKTEFVSTGLKEKESVQIQLYPNPVTDILYLSADSRIDKVEILSINGQILKRIDNNVTSIDLSSLSKGVYLVKIETDFGVISGRIIKK